MLVEWDCEFLTGFTAFSNWSLLGVEIHMEFSKASSSSL